MNALGQSLERIRDDLDEGGRPWALVGALAVAAWADARATLDVDVAVATSGVEEADELVAELREKGYVWRAAFGRSMVSLLVPGGPEAGLRLDLLFSLTGFENEVAEGAVRLEVLPGVELPVARRGDLIAMKLLSAGTPSREHDLRDLRQLVATASGEDLERTRAAIELLRRRAVPGAEGLEERLAVELKTRDESGSS